MAVGIAILFVIGFYAVIIAIVKIVEQLLLKAFLFTHTVHLSEKQHPEIYAIAKQQSEELGLDKTPEILVMDGSGMLNAFATQILRGKYVFLFSGLVDMALERDKINELKATIAHELAHHRLGHTNPFWNFFTLLVNPRVVFILLIVTLYAWFIFTAIAAKQFSMDSSVIWLIGFFGIIIMLFLVVGSFIHLAWSRACELSCDRIGYLLADKDKESAHLSLLTLIQGSKYLANDINLDSFVKQEEKSADIWKILVKIFLTHPLPTRRVIELDKFAAEYN